jgi:O-antigen ligase/polysaccharide polymerase Wzy-like membrane protein
MHSAYDENKGKLYSFCLLSLCLIFIIPLFLPVYDNGVEGLEKSINNFVYIGCSLFIFSSLIYSVKKKIWVKPQYLNTQILVLLCLMIPLLWQDISSTKGVLRLIGVVFGFIYFVSLFQVFSKNNIEKLQFVISLSGFFIISAAVVYILSIYGLIKLPFIIYTSFNQPNVVACYLLTCFLMTLFLYINKNKKHISAIFIIFLSVYACAFGFLLAIFNSQSAYLGIFLSVPLLFLSGVMNQRRLVIITVSILIGFMIHYSLDNKTILEAAWFNKSQHQISHENSQSQSTFSNIASEDFLNIRKEVSADINTRKSMWLITLNIIKDNWLKGNGYGNFERAYFDYQAEYYQKHNIYIVPDLSHPHNELLFWFVEGGIIPFTALLGYIFFILYLIVSNRKTNLAYMALLLPIAINAMLELPFYLYTLSWILFVTVWATFLIETGRHDKIELKSTVPLVSSASLFLIVSMTFFITNLYAIQALQKYYRTNDQQEIKVILSSIVNPVAISLRLKYIQLTGMLYRGLETGDKKILNESMQLAQEVFNYRPRPHIYKDMMHVYKVLGQEDNYKKILHQARYHFPLDTDFEKLAHEYHKQYLDNTDI